MLVKFDVGQLPEDVIFMNYQFVRIHTFFFFPRVNMFKKKINNHYDSHKIVHLTSVRKP